MIQFPNAVIIVVTMAGCPACQEHVPRVRKIAKSHPNIPVYFIDAAAQRGSQEWQIAERYGVRATPTTLVLRRGPGSIKVEGVQEPADIEYLFRVAEAG